MREGDKAWGHTLRDLLPLHKSSWVLYLLAAFLYSPILFSSWFCFDVGCALCLSPFSIFAGRKEMEKNERCMFGTSRRQRRAQLKIYMDIERVKTYRKIHSM